MSTTEPVERRSSEPAGQPGFQELVFSDLARHRPGDALTWPRVLARCLTVPGMLASVILRGQQHLSRTGHDKAAHLLQVLGVSLVGADFGPGMTIGPGLLIAHPVGLTMGYGLRIGTGVTLAGGVTAAARHYDGDGPQEFAVIEDGATIGANSVLIGGVRIGRNSTVGANSVVLNDVPDDCVVFGAPARVVSRRDRS